MVAISTQDFLKRVIPVDGVRYWYGTTEAGPVPPSKWKQDPANDIHALITELNKLRDAGKNTYYATASYKAGGPRTQKAVALKKCHYADIDAGPGKPYATVKDALEAVKAYLKTGAVPYPSLIVNSGGGIHLYWELSTPVTGEEWQPVADALKRRMLRDGLEIDPKITDDSTRVLRLPGTINTKPGRPPTTCTLIQDSNKLYENYDLLGGTSPHEPTGIDAPWQAPPNQPTEKQFAPKFAEPMLNRCGVMRNARETQGSGAPGTLWHNVLHVLAFTEDGSDYIHEVSRGHDTYTPKGTEKRFQHSLNIRKRKDAGEDVPGPTFCNTFAKEPMCAAICAACPYRDKVKTPAQLGDVATLDLPDGYFQSATGLFVRTVVKPKKGDDEPEEKTLFIMPYNVLDLRIAKDAEQGDQAFLRINNPTIAHKDRETVFNMKYLSGGSEGAFSEAITKAGMVFNPHELKLFKEFLVAWIRKLQQAGQVQRIIRSYGWLDHDDKHGFAVGNKVFWADGTGDTTLRTDDQLARQYLAMGNIEPWQEACDLVLQQGRPEFSAIIASAFAAPLIRYVGINGALLSIVSRQSGTGKSTALQIAQGVWGSPQEGINSLNDTVNSVVKKLSTIRHLPAYWDELRMKEDVKNFVKMVFQLSQGKEKSRSKADMTMQSMGTWETLLIAASNEPLLDHVDHQVHGTDAGQQRIFEMVCNSPVPSSTPLPTAMNIFGRLKNNYGHAGLIYGKYLAENGDAVKKLVEDNREKIANKLGVGSADRFRLSIVTVLVTGAQIAKKLGIAHFDMAGLIKYLIEQFRMLEQAGTESARADSAVTRVQEYVNFFADSKLVTKSNLSLGALGRHTGMMITEVPKKLPLRFRIHESPTDTIIAVDAGMFTNWVHERYQLMKSNVRDELSKMGVTLSNLALAAGTSYGIGKTHCFLITSTSAAGAALGLDELAVVEAESAASSG